MPGGGLRPYLLLKGVLPSTHKLQPLLSRTTKRQRELIQPWLEHDLPTKNKVAAARRRNPV